ncbi:ribonuclease P protein component 4 [Ignisphaera sp. 4213-co]|uniref:Ribonuclease P protein component 4 n=1 Tax=Ignisphaera cupida TaxID=3050454 RepID=A0ABD4Z716_9CREN|nr:ribonuclease P protein component 4 [Ignisphaera sp. 4213-co]MDK6028519.1 ribonuclease P protein component 4 [Ignisphaera sp. 4213-co]
MKRRESISIRDIALERMDILFRLGVEAVKNGYIDLAKRYGELIRRISMRNRIKIPREMRRWICKNCYTIMVPGFNARVRTRRDGKVLRVVTRCLYCGWIHRYQFVRRGSNES